MAWVLKSLDKQLHVRNFTAVTLCSATAAWNRPFIEYPITGRCIFQQQLNMRGWLPLYFTKDFLVSWALKPTKHSYTSEIKTKELQSDSQIKKRKHCCCHYHEVSTVGKEKKKHIISVLFIAKYVAECWKYLQRVHRMNIHH